MKASLVIIAILIVLAAVVAVPAAAQSASFEVIVNGPAFRIVDYSLGYVCYGSGSFLWCDKVATIYLQNAKGVK